MTFDKRAGLGIDGVGLGYAVLEVSTPVVKDTQSSQFLS